MKVHVSGCIALLLLVGCTQETQPPALAYDCNVTLPDLQHVDGLVGTMQAISPWGDDTALDSIAVLNDDIERELAALLSCGAMETLSLDEGSFDNLGFVETPDARLRSFNWYANNGGTWQEMRQMFSYISKAGEARNTPTAFFAGPSSFYQLASASRPSYIGLGGDRTCSTCVIDYADFFAIEGDSLIHENIIVLDSRAGSLLKFEFDAATETLSYAVVVDDLNGEWAADHPRQRLADVYPERLAGGEFDSDAEVVTGKMVFDTIDFWQAKSMN